MVVDVNYWYLGTRRRQPNTRKCLDRDEFTALKDKLWLRLSFPPMLHHEADRPSLISCRSVEGTSLEARLDATALTRKSVALSLHTAKQPLETFEGP